MHKLLLPAKSCVMGLVSEFQELKINSKNGFDLHELDLLMNFQIYKLISKLASCGSSATEQNKPYKLFSTLLATQRCTRSQRRAVACFAASACIALSHIKY